MSAVLGEKPNPSTKWTKVTVVLMDRQIVYLDRLASDIRANTSAAISRTEIIRALVDSLAESKFDVTRVDSESELKGRIADRLREKRPRR